MTNIDPWSGKPDPRRRWVTADKWPAARSLWMARLGLACIVILSAAPFLGIGEGLLRVARLIEGPEPAIMRMGPDDWS